MNRIVYTVSVREVAEFVHRRGDLKSVGGPTALQGAEGHRMLQETRPKGYRPEVSLTGTVETERLRIIVSGRADGIYTDKRPHVLEEIKTTVESPLLITGDNPVHWAQAELYGALYMKQEAQHHLLLRLTYLDLHSGRTRSFERSRTAEEADAFFEHTLAVYTGWIDRVVAYRMERDRRLEKATFPFSAFRPGQALLRERVSETARTGGRLLAEAPTGLGKTAAVLSGALSAMADGAVSQVVFLTAKNAGRRAASDALDRIREKSGPLKVLTLFAKADRCTQANARCSTPECPSAAGHFDRLRPAVDALFDAPDTDEPTLDRIAQAHRICPYLLGRELARYADVVIADYNYFFDPGSRMGALFDRTLGDRIVLGDEAHNLVDRGREMFSAAIDTGALRKAAASPLPPQVKSALVAAADALARFGRESDAPVETPRRVEEIPERVLAALEDAGNAAALFPVQFRPRDEDAPHPIEVCFDAMSFVRAIRRAVPGDIPTVLQTGREIRLSLFARDPGPHLRRVMDESKAAAVLFSATLSPSHFFAPLLGLGDTDQRLSLPDPFLSHNRLVATAEHISTRYRDRASSLNALAELIGEVVQQKRGNYLVFFPSHAYLSQLAAVLRLTESRFEIVVQRPNPTPDEKRIFVEQFQAPPGDKSKVGLAVLGGMFGEALDLPGDALIGAIVVSPGLPPVSHRQDLIRAHFEDTRGKGFEFAYVYPGMNKVRQAAGRVIRTETDRGILLFVGRRFGEPTYRNLLPCAPDSLVRCRSAEAVQSAVSTFWKKSAP